MNNTRFATAIHILILLADNLEEWQTSEMIAGSININPVIVRKELSVLKKFSLIESKKGKEGGCRLAKESKKIFLADIYTAVNHSDVLGRKNLSPNPQCNIGKNINKNLDILFEETDNLVIEHLKHITLEHFLQKFK